ncbi:hypothetical protein [Kurthia gibsonii]|uniref:hypothetical protein n=1 Tax=Kurthia gibsonii TaxID=33946 RepID=UPI00301B45FE
MSPFTNLTVEGFGLITLSALSLAPKIVAVTSEPAFRFTSVIVTSTDSPSEDKVLVASTALPFASVKVQLPSEANGSEKFTFTLVEFTFSVPTNAGAVVSLPKSKFLASYFGKSLPSTSLTLSIVTS